FLLSFFYVILHMFMIFSYFFNDTATSQIYTLSLHDALPILAGLRGVQPVAGAGSGGPVRPPEAGAGRPGRGGDLSHASFPRRARSEEHTSELQSRGHLVCRLLLEKKKIVKNKNLYITICVLI